MGAFSIPLIGAGGDWLPVGAFPTRSPIALGSPSIISRPSVPPAIPSPNIDFSDWGSTLSSLVGTGLGAWQTDLQANLLQSQINHGQTPSIVAGANGTPSAGYSYTVNPQTGAITYSAGNGVGAASNAFGSLLSSGLVWILLAVVVLVLLLGRR